MGRAVGSERLICTQRVLDCLYGRFLLVQKLVTRIAAQRPKLELGKGRYFIDSRQIIRGSCDDQRMKSR